MDMAIPILFIIFMLLVDWRLNKIYLEIKKLNDANAKALQAAKGAQP